MIRILLLSPHSHLEVSLHELLAQRADLALVGTERDLGCAVERVCALQPSVVIANDQEAALDSIILHLLKEALVPVVIALNAANNHLRLYRSEEWEVNQMEDLSKPFGQSRS